MKKIFLALFLLFASTQAHAAYINVNGQCTATPSAGAVAYVDARTALCTSFNVGQLTANVTSSTFSGFQAGKIYTFRYQQGASTAYSFVWPANFLNFPSAAVPALGKILIVTAQYDGTNVRFLSAMTDAGYGSCPAGTAPTGNPTGGSYTYCSATSDNPQALLPGGQTTQMVLPVLYAADTAASGTIYTACPPEMDTGIGLVTGMEVRFYPATASSGGTTTLNLCALGAKSIFRKDGTTTLTTREWLASTPHLLFYNGTAWIEEQSNFPRILANNNAIASDTLASCVASTSPVAFSTTYTLPANELGTGSKIHIRGAFRQTTTSGIAASYIFILLGGTQVGEQAISITTALTAAGMGYDLVITGTATPGASTVINLDTGSATANLKSSSISAIATNGTLSISVAPAVAVTGSQTCSYTNDVMEVERIN